MIIPILGKILGSGDVVEKGMALIDSMHTSTEEEITAKSKGQDRPYELPMQPFKLAQRYHSVDVHFHLHLVCFAITYGHDVSREGRHRWC